MKSLTVNVYDTDLVWKALIEDIQSFTHRSSWHEIVYSEMKISKTAQGIEELLIGRILVVNNDLTKALIVEDITTTLTDQFWTVSLLSLKGMLNYRICHPTDTGAAYTATTQSAVMMSLASRNLVTQTRDPDRKFWSSAGSAGNKNMFGVAASKSYGATIDFTVDWNTGYIGETIVTIAKMNVDGAYPVGWNIYINSGFTQLVMDTYNGVDRSTNQSALPPVVFSEEYGNIKDANYSYSIKDWRNVVYMTWNNGTADQSTPVGNTVNGATIAFNRKELVVSSSKKTSNEVVAEGRSELNKRPHVESFTAEIINNTSTMSTYGIDWNLGDIVTVQSKSIIKGAIVTVHAQITEIEEIYDSGEYSINATFGEGKLSLIQLIKNAINQK